MNEVIKRMERLAAPMPESGRRRMKERSENRAMYRASVAIAAKISRELRLRGMKRCDLAEKLGKTQAVVSRYLSGKANFELKTLVEIEAVLGINLIDREHDREREKTNVVIININKNEQEYSEFQEEINLQKYA